MRERREQHCQEMFDRDEQREFIERGKIKVAGGGRGGSEEREREREKKRKKKKKGQEEAG